jgi:hypothetical protein
VGSFEGDLWHLNKTLKHEEYIYSCDIYKYIHNKYMYTHIYIYIYIYIYTYTHIYIYDCLYNFKNILMEVILKHLRKMSV